MRQRGVVGLVILAAVCAAPGQTPVRGSSCETCHSKAAADHLGSRHEAAGITCVTCHGGDPNDMTVGSMSPAKGFRGQPARRDQPAFCADCHAKGERMRPYGLPTDQYAEYQESHHGQAVLAGSLDAAVCSDCHTAHRILGPDDPRSSVAPVNVPTTCAQCHDDAVRMGRAGVPTGQFAAYTESVHGQMLAAGSDAAPSCASCHGSHGAAPPDIVSVGHICQRCHPVAWEQFSASPHAEAVDKGRMSPCVACHGTHDIQHPTDTLLRSSCQACHADNAAVAALSGRLADEIASARAAYAEAEAGLGAHHEVGFETIQLEAALQEAHTALLRLPAAQHSLEPRDVERQAVVVRAAFEQYEHAEQEHRERQQIRRAALLYLWGFFGVSILGFCVQRQRFEHRRRAAGPPP